MAFLPNGQSLRQDIRSMGEYVYRQRHERTDALQEVYMVPAGLSIILEDFSVIA